MQDCFGYACFALAKDSPKFFGFAEYLAALALMVVAWTLAGIRYKFRIGVAIFPLLRMSFVIVAFVGVATLATDFWRAEERFLIEGTIISPAGWQALLGGLFLFVFLSWIWFAIIFPSKFNRWNSEFFKNALHRIILKGNVDECRDIAEELGRSAGAIIHHAWTFTEYRQIYGNGLPQLGFVKNKIYKVRSHANSILMLIADMRFCRYLVKDSSVVIFDIFYEVVDAKKYDISIGVFAKNITVAAIEDRSSFVYQEVGGFHNGYIGEARSFTTILYGDYDLIESANCIFSIFECYSKGWDDEQWAAYFNLILVVFKNYVVSGKDGERSRTFLMVMGGLNLVAYPDIDLTVGGGSWRENVEYKKFAEVCGFLKKSISILNNNRTSTHPIPMRKIDNNGVCQDIYDDLASAVYDKISIASQVRSDKGYCWQMQYRIVWNGFFGVGTNYEASKIIKYKVRRLIYDGILELKTWPNFNGANLISMMLRIHGFLGVGGNLDKEARNFHGLVLKWLKVNYIELVGRDPNVAMACLFDEIEYDAVGKRLLKTEVSFNGLSTQIKILALDSPVA
ncbi:hypothetical protein [Janthinobacterium tructae]|uniref:hypothetical protein n=1 Tax=Janthinobacterium tructae TaxID=2590869 RepID=UPI00249AE28A|nr:hypothetical protein [Janthinobacterium tructae]MDI3297424.1 hypothetical protein [Janthinobacterium tructae]